MSDKKQKQNNFTGVNRFIRSESIQAVKDRREEGSLRDILDDWRWIFSYSARYKWIIVLYTVLGIIGSTFGLVSAVVSKYMIDIVVSRTTEKLWLLMALMISTMLFSMIFTSVRNRLTAKISVYVNNDIQADIMRQVMDADWSHVSGFSNGDLLNRVSSDIETISSNAVNWIPTLIIDLYTFVASFVVIFHYDRVMAFIALAGAPLLLIPSRLIMRGMRKYRMGIRKSKSRLMSFQTEVFYNMDTIKSFGITGLFERRLRTRQDDYRQAALDSNAYDIKARIFTNIIGTAVAVAAFIYCLMRLWGGAITFGTMTLFLQQRSTLTNHFSSLVGVVPGMLNGSVAAQRLRELTELPEEPVDEKTAAELAKAGENGFSVKMSDVCFSYSGEAETLRGGSLIADPGEIVALIGPSGGGKTTMLRLLLGLVHPDSGSVEFRAGDRSWPAGADVRRCISYVPQGNSIIAGSVADNLRMVKEDATVSEIESALETACAYDFVKKMPDGIDTVIGERGHGISEGQAQRLAIARAVLRGAPVLLLDEATSALDVATERKVLNNIMECERSRTVIVTTHRPSVLSLCRRVYRVEDGTVTELSGEESGRLAMDF